MSHGEFLFLEEGVELAWGKVGRILLEGEAQGAARAKFRTAVGGVSFQQMAAVAERAFYLL